MGIELWRRARFIHGAHDPRVTAIVVQVAAQQLRLGAALDRPHQGGSVGARRDRPDPRSKRASQGTPQLAKMVYYRPLATAGKIRLPTLVIDVEQEELFDRKQNGRALYGVVSPSAPARYVKFPCKHFAIRDQYYGETSNLAPLVHRALEEGLELIYTFGTR